METLRTGTAGHQDIGWSLALVSGNGWTTSQCSTILPFSSRKKSTATVPGSSAEVLSNPWVTTMSPSPTTRLISMLSSGELPSEPGYKADECIGTVGCLRVVLDVLRAEELLDGLLGLLGVEGELIELNRGLLVALDVGHGRSIS